VDVAVVVLLLLLARATEAALLLLPGCAPKKSVGKARLPTVVAAPFDGVCCRGCCSSSVDKIFLGRPLRLVLLVLLVRLFGVTAPSNAGCGRKASEEVKDAAAHQRRCTNKGMFRMDFMFIAA